MKKQKSLNITKIRNIRKNKLSKNNLGVCVKNTCFFVKYYNDKNKNTENTLRVFVKSNIRKFLQLLNTRLVQQ